MKKGYAKLLLPVVTVAVVMLAGASVFALSSRKDAHIEFIIGPTLTIGLSSDDVSIENLIPGTADDSNEISVDVFTNNESGYTLNAAVGTDENNSSSLIRVGDGTADYFECLPFGTTVSEITTDRTWGYSLDHGTTYSGLPIKGDGNAELINTTTDPANDSFPFSIGARANLFQTPGEYRNIVTFTVVANPVPDTIATTRYMQDINDDVYASMEMEQQYQLIDKRDNKKYWVAKLKDGNVWMTQNLSYELEVPTTVLYPETSNVSGITTLKVSDFNPDEVQPGKYFGDVTYSKIDPNTYIEDGTFNLGNKLASEDTKLKSTEDLDADNENWHYQVGVGYLGNGDQYCPKGWRAPNWSYEINDQYSLAKLIQEYPYVGTAPTYLIATPKEPIRNSMDTGWTEGSYLNYSNILLRIKGDDEIDTYYDTYYSDANNYAFSRVRCVAYRTHSYTYRFIVDDNEVIYERTAQSWGGVDPTVKAVEYNYVDKLDYQFAGWASTPNATTAEYQPGDAIYTNMDGDNNFYVVWEPVPVSLEDAFAAAGKTKVDGEHYAMQDMTVDICNAASINSSINLVDTRDGNVYKVAKYKRAENGTSGTCWMIENLRLGDGQTEYNLTPNDTDISDNFTLPASNAALSSTTPEYNMDYNYADNNGGRVGNNYNYYALTAGTDDTKNGSICPKGWTVPAYEGDKSFRELFESYGIGPNSDYIFNQRRTSFDFTNNYYYWTSKKGSYTNNNQLVVYQTLMHFESNGDGDYRWGTGTTYHPSSDFEALRCIIRTERRPQSQTVDPSVTAKAILGNNGNLYFVFDNNTYTAGSSYTDNIGTTTISAVFDVPKATSESYQPAWQDYSYNKVSFSDSFRDFQPYSTAYWFRSRTITLYNLHNIDTSRVLNMREMFSYSNISFNNDSFSVMNTGNVTDMSYMFYYAYDSSSYSTVTFDLNSWDVSAVKDMSYMFYHAGYYARNWTLNASNWNTGNVTNMEYMLGYIAAYTNNSSANMDLTNWDVHNVKNMQGMFYYYGSRANTSWSMGNLGNWDVSKVTNMHYMFGNALRYATAAVDWDLSGWDVSHVSDLSYMFAYFASNAVNWHLNLNNWNMQRAQSVSYMFYQTGTSSNVNSWILDTNNWRFGDGSTVYTESSYYSANTNLTYLFNYAGMYAKDWQINGTNTWDVSRATSFYYMFAYAGQYATNWSLNLSGWDVRNVTSTYGMFQSAGYYSTTWSANLDNWKFTKITSFQGMFASTGYTANTWTLSARNWDVRNSDSSSISMYYMFNSAGASVTNTWSIIGADTWVLNNVTNMEQMFAYTGYNANTYSLGDIGGWDVSKVTTMYGMFDGAGTESTNWDVSGLENWNVGKVSNHEYFTSRTITEPHWVQ